jgi:hypothetical protein
MNVLALDERVRAGVVACELSTWNHYARRMRMPPHCDCGIYSQLPGLLEQCDWAALAAPKPVQFQHGFQDASYCPGADERSLKLDWNRGVMPQLEYDALFAEVRRAYALTGSVANVASYVHGGDHEVDNAAAMEWICNALELEIDTV